MITNSVDEAILLSDRILTLGRGPGALASASLSVAVPVTLSRPRASDLMMHNEEAVWVRARVTESLTSRSTGDEPDRFRGTVASEVAVEV
jgi:ABC-type nitrate/sulfonate/bicarbonate transport system ATPase subunit